MFTYTASSSTKLIAVPEREWRLPEMHNWTEENVKALLDLAEISLRNCVDCLGLPVQVLRKKRAVGIYPPKGTRLSREQLEETVLVVQRILESSEAGQRIPFCAFNGGNDVFVDIGDKSYGVMACQRYFGGIEGGNTLHVGDQFLSAGANDFKVSESQIEVLRTANEQVQARLACTTAWIASPSETCNLLDEVNHLSNAI